MYEARLRLAQAATSVNVQMMHYRLILTKMDTLNAALGYD